MEKWITGKDIVNKSLLNEATLVMQFGSGALSGYRLADNFEAQMIILEHEKEIFLAIQRLCAPKICTISKTVKNPNYRNPNLPRSWEHPPEQPTCTILVDVECYRFSRGIERKWISWEQLLKILLGAGHEDRWPVVEISPTQLGAIEAGWNVDRIRELAFSSYFKEYDISLLSDGKPAEYLSYDVHPLMPEELRICNEAWKSLYSNKTQTEGKKIRKEEIKTWLQKHHRELSDNAVERMTTVINPHKKGGATPSL